MLRRIQTRAAAVSQIKRNAARAAGSRAKPVADGAVRMSIAVTAAPYPYPVTRVSLSVPSGGSANNSNATRQATVQGAGAGGVPGAKVKKRRRRHRPARRVRTELREVTGEMAAVAAVRLSEKELREHCDRVEEEGRRLRGVIADVTAAALELLVAAEAAARQRLQNGERAKRRGLQGRQWKASLKKVRAREPAQAEAVFAARGLSMSELRRTHLGKGPTTNEDSYAAGKGLYNLFLALRPGGPVERFAMRELLKGETNVKHVYYNTQGQEVTWGDTDFTIPAGDAYELAACVLCHLPALEVLGFSYLPPVSTRSLEWVSHLPQCMRGLSFWYTDYTVADLREIHHRRGDRAFLVDVDTDKCTDWGELEGVGDDDTKMARVNEELGGMVYWCY